jgi:Carbohydrate binding module (family 6)/Secretion system C-terminal sorting domain
MSLNYRFGAISGEPFYSVSSTGTLRITYAAGEAPVIGVKIGNGSVQTINLNATGGWSTYQTINTNISVPAGTATIRIQGGSGYIRLDKFCISSGGRMAAQEQPDELALHIAPNPSSGRFTVHFQTKPGEIATLQLTDVNGKAIRATQTIMGTGQQHSEAITLPATTRGIIVVSVVSGERRASQKVLIE